MTIGKSRSIAPFVKLVSRPEPSCIEWTEKKSRYIDRDFLLLELASNPSSRAFELFIKKVGEAWRYYTYRLKSNTAAIELIKANARLFGADCNYYGNPGIFTEESNTRLIKRLSKFAIY